MDCSTAACMDCTNKLCVSKNWVQQGLNRPVNVAGFFAMLASFSVLTQREVLHLFIPHLSWVMEEYPTRERYVQVKLLCQILEFVKSPSACLCRCHSRRKFTSWSLEQSLQHVSEEKRFSVQLPHPGRHKSVMGTFVCSWYPAWQDTAKGGCGARF